MSDHVIFTIGHSDHSMDRFIELLRANGVTAVADVRTSPVSRWHPHFSRDAFKRSLADAGIGYVFMGRELGGRPHDKALYQGRTADYERMAESPAVKAGLQRIAQGARTRTIAVVCAERDPLDCHRMLLVARRLSELGLVIRHILVDGSVEEHEQAEHRLLREAGLERPDLFAPAHPERLAQAYRARSLNVAFTEREDRFVESRRATT